MDTPGRSDRRDSQQTLISLLQLDPSPMDTPSPPPREVQELQELTNSLPRDASEPDARPIRAKPTAGAPGLSGNGGHGAIYYLTRVQRYSSYAISVFTSLHLANVSLIPLVTGSVAGSETYLLMTREIYQTRLAEPLLVALPVAAHVGSGVALRLLRRWQNMRRYGGATPGMYALHRSMQAPKSRGVCLWPSLSYISISGYVFAALYSAHVLVNRVLPLVVDGDSSNIGLAYVAHSFSRHPGLSLAAYVGLIGAGCGHMVWGAARWLGLSRSTSVATGGDGIAANSHARRQWMSVHGAALALAALWAAGGLGVVARDGPAQGWIATAYNDVLARAGL